MESVIGIFGSRVAAEQAVRGLVARGLSSQFITFLSGEAGSAEVENLPTTDAENDGMGETMGAVVGGAVGAGAGLSLGSAVASLLVPGVGPIVAIGLGAAALLGLGGAAAGAKAGDLSEHAMDKGVPRDDVSFYRELLKRGRSIVIAEVDHEDQAASAREVFEQRGGEDVDAARKELHSAA
jgi:hypothetical protein